MTTENNDKTLASWWNTPVMMGETDDMNAGAPVACIATTYTFDAAFYETELLPRFLGLKYDHTEREVSFLIEREQMLETARACVLVDHTHVDPNQTTLRWDQLRVRVPNGSQHAKITVLAWERCLRIIIASANLTRPGYRRNREVAGVLDFYDGSGSVPLEIAKDTLGFIRKISSTGWIQADNAARERLTSTVQSVEDRLARWKAAPAEFTPREIPRVAFIGGRPASDGQPFLSVIEQVARLWGGRKATSVAVLTPFSGETERGMKGLVQKIMDLSRSSSGSVETCLGIPGSPSEEPGSRKMISGLPSFFYETWNKTWGKVQDGPDIYVVPPLRKGEKQNRELHAKALSISDSDRDLLLCGSSNFTPHGMGVNAANIEANLCYIDAYRERSRLESRLPVRWNNEDDDDYCDAKNVTWPAETIPPLDETPQPVSAPPVFKAITYKERAAELTVHFDPAQKLPSAWSLFPQSAKIGDAAALIIDSQQLKTIPPGNSITVAMPVVLKGQPLTSVRVVWTDKNNKVHSAWLPVQTVSPDDLLPPEQFRSLSAERIMSCLISGRDLAELVDDGEGGSDHIADKDTVASAFDPLRDIDTTGYTLYQIRKLGQALAALAERLLRTVCTRDAIAYRLTRDPLGPVALAEALTKELIQEAQSGDIAKMRLSQLTFSYVEIALTLAYTSRRMHAKLAPGDHDVRAEYREVIKDLLEKAKNIGVLAGQFNALGTYVNAVRTKCDLLIGIGD